ncbi:carboxymuconolactone decarboxylase family protein [Oceanicella actignis]|uniref:Alkylhydroperoxidase AhpD family core domain-containing protein n=1 Tax=Oceanicella actignis TaxID=1189325 RepID=A0A1M7TSP9_9RHOB|nr:carboxymuconolactone decarboxylase family protein [Oceanicella actignis]SET76613.1 alkylhydroperoxidase AhpD family core domain-containing protein [Oceanicella actignis]SHN73700.1 alkylhydroperoxidase AhpD family core domain-containing protein [Oceanicella actignis]
MNWSEFLKDTTREVAAFNKTQPDVAAGFQALARAATANGALDPKTKELIALAIGVAARCDACIGYHVKACIRHGATREEVAETIGMRVYMGGGPSLMYGAKALAAFDELSG